MTNRTAIRCNVCGCETAVANIQPGSKVFCLHCGRLITDYYQPGMEFQQGVDYQPGVNYQQGPEFNQPPQPSSTPEETVVPPPPPPPPIDNSYSQQGNAPMSPQPSWMTEPLIRINWKRLNYIITRVADRIGLFVSNCVTKIQERFRSESAQTKAPPAQFEEQLNNPPIPDQPPPPPPPVQEPEAPFGRVDMRQARMQQSFSRSFADSGAIPAAPSNPNYAQQRMDQSFSNSFADSGAIPVPPSNPNYSQKRIDQSFTNSFAESGAIPASPSNPNYSQQRIDQSFTKSFQENENKQS